MAAGDIGEVTTRAMEGTAGRQASRRGMLRWTAAGGAALTGGVLAGRFAAGEALAQAGGHLSGVWMSAFLRNDVPPGTTPNRVPTLFTPDGGVVIGFRTGGVTPDSRPAYSSHGLGQWTKTGAREFVWAYVTFNWEETRLVNQAMFRVTVTLNDVSDAFTGTFSGGQFDLEGNALLTLEGTITGRRLLSVP